MGLPALGNPGIAAVFAFTLVLFRSSSAGERSFVAIRKLGTMIYFLQPRPGYIIVEVGMISPLHPGVLSNATVSGVGSDHRHAGVLRHRQFLLRTLSRLRPHGDAAHLPGDLRHPGALTPFTHRLRARLDRHAAPCAAHRACLLLVLLPVFHWRFPMPTAMTTLGWLGKDHMFLWAWGINGCASTINPGADRGPRTSVCRPWCWSALSPIRRCWPSRKLMPFGQTAARCRVKRRALLLGAVLMPTMAREYGKAAREVSAAPASDADGDAAALLPGARSQLVDSKSPRPFRIATAKTSCLWRHQAVSLDARDDGGKRAATPTCRGDVILGADLWRRSGARWSTLPPGFGAAQPPALIVAVPARPGRPWSATWWAARAYAAPARRCRSAAWRNLGGAAARRRCHHRRF